MERRAKFDKEQIELRSLLLYFIFICACCERDAREVLLLSSQMQTDPIGVPLAQLHYLIQT
jgi:hypothetical protein